MARAAHVQYLLRTGRLADGEAMVIERGRLHRGASPTASTDPNMCAPRERPLAMLHEV